MKKKLIPITILLLLILLSIIIPTNRGILIKNKENFHTQDSRNILYCPYFDIKSNNDTYRTDDNNMTLSIESNKSICIIKVSNPNEIHLEYLSWNITQNTIGKKKSSGAFSADCQIYDKTKGNGLFPLITMDDYGWIQEIKLQYLHYQFGKKVNYTYDNRTLKEFDNKSIVSASIEYLFVPSTIPPGTWYLVFSSVIYDLTQTDVSTNQLIRIVFSGNCSNTNISVSKGGKIYGFCYREYNANAIVSKSNILEMMINGKKSFHVENTLFYWYSYFPMNRGFWNLKWITPEGVKTFQLLVIHEHLIYDENDTEGCIWGMGENGDYEIITSYLDYSQILYGSIPAFYPIFIGMDVTLP